MDYQWYYGNGYNSPYAFDPHDPFMRSQAWEPHRRQMTPRNRRSNMGCRYARNTPMWSGNWNAPPLPVNGAPHWNTPPRPWNGAPHWNAPPRNWNGAPHWNAPPHFWNGSSFWNNSPFQSTHWNGFSFLNGSQPPSNGSQPLRASPPRSSNGSHRGNSTRSEGPLTLHRATGCQTPRPQETVNIEYELTQSFAVDPNVFDKESPGIDFYFPKAGIGMTIEGGKQVVINTHVIMKFPKGIVGVMMDKSSKVTGKQLKVEAGVIDTGYRGEISIVLRNMSDEQVEIQPGEAIAQMLLLSYGCPVLKKVERIEADTNRGTRGFGKEQPVERCEIL